MSGKADRVQTNGEEVANAVTHVVGSHLGAAMLALSGVKPSFGIRLPYAWCGSPVWFDRRSHIITALAPVLLWGILLQILIAALPREWFWPLWLTQLSNLSGSAGDIYCVYYLARMKGELLIQDTGTRMRIMRKI